MNTLEERILLRSRQDMLNYIRLKASFEEQRRTILQRLSDNAISISDNKE